MREDLLISLYLKSQYDRSLSKFPSFLKVSLNDEGRIFFVYLYINKCCWIEISKII